MAEKPKPRTASQNRRAKGPLPGMTGAKPRRARASIHPWDQIRDHYMTSESTLTLKELADIYNMSYETLRTKAGDERWTYLRAEHQTKASTARQEARTIALVKESVSFDDTSLKAAKMGQTLILGRLSQIGQLFQASGINFDKTLAKIRAGQPVELHELRSSINYKELVELANALDRFQNVGRKALGTDVEKVDIHQTINGSVTEVHIAEELSKPDLDRMAATVAAMRRAGLTGLLAEQLQIEASGDEEEGTIDGEVVRVEGAEDDGDEQGEGSGDVDDRSPAVEGTIVG